MRSSPAARGGELCAKHTIGLGLLLPLAAVLSGCGVGTLAPFTSPAATPQALRGKAHGGQQPVAGAQIALYTFGATGYGSAGSLLATATTDQNGQFSIDPASMNCPSPDAPLYILSVGGNPGNPGGQVNSAISLGAALGTCANATQAYVTINEISTAMLAYTFSQFFSNANADDVTSDHFGAPSDEGQVITNGNSGTINTLINTTEGMPLPNSPTMTFESNKLINIGNILGACVNSAGPTSPACAALFSNTSYNGIAPANTLEAAVGLALQPTQNVAQIFAVTPQGNASAFPGGLTTAPADWTLSASYTAPTFGLGVNPRTVTTLDVDATGRVWFPSNRSTQGGGVGYFDPSTGTFSQLFTGNVAHPQQVAIDRNNTAWVADSGSPNIAGFPAGNPSSPTLLVSGRKHLHNRHHRQRQQPALRHHRSGRHARSRSGHRRKLLRGNPQHRVPVLHRVLRLQPRWQPQRHLRHDGPVPVRPIELLPLLRIAAGRGDQHLSVR